MHFLTKILIDYIYDKYMKVKIFDEEHELDLEDKINDFLDELDGELISIQYCTTAFMDKEEQVFSFSALLLYE